MRVVFFFSIGHAPSIILQLIKSLVLTIYGVPFNNMYPTHKYHILCIAGAYMVVKIIIEMVRMKLEGSNEGIGSLIKDLEDPLESIELRMDILSEPKDVKAKAIEIIETFKSYIEVHRCKIYKLLP